MYSFTCESFEPPDLTLRANANSQNMGFVGLHVCELQIKTIAPILAHQLVFPINTIFSKCRLSLVHSVICSWHELYVLYMNFSNLKPA